MNTERSKVSMAVGRLRAAPRGLLKQSNRCRKLPLLRLEKAQVVQRFGMVRVKLVAFPETQSFPRSIIRVA